MAGGEGWVTDFEAAKKQAVEENKDLLVDFTGSDWCGWCIRLRNEVFVHDAFKDGVKDHFVLVELDYPRDKSNMSEELLAQNKQLAGKYAIRGYPTVLLMDHKGVPYGRTGYKKGGAEEYVKHLNELRAGKVKAAEAFAEAEKLEGVAKAGKLLFALDGLGLDSTILAAFYGDVIEQIKAADPDDKTGYVKREETRKRQEKFQKELNGFARKKDYDGAVKLIDSNIKDDGMDDLEKQQMMRTKAMILSLQNKFDAALETLKEAKAVAPESKLAAGLGEFEANILKRREKIEKVEKAKAE